MIKPHKNEMQWQIHGRLQIYQNISNQNGITSRPNTTQVKNSIMHEHMAMSEWKYNDNYIHVDFNFNKICRIRVEMQYQSHENFHFTRISFACRHTVAEASKYIYNLCFKVHV